MLEPLEISWQNLGVKELSFKRGKNMQLFGKTFQIIEKALNLRSKKAAIITSNLVNIDTPGYKAKDLPFKKIMEQYLNADYGSGLKMETTEPGHMNMRGELNEGINNNISFSNDPELLATNPRHYRFGLEEDNSGLVKNSKERGTPNNVDLDLEMAKLAKNNLEYQATVQALIKEFEMLKNAIEGGK